jgi:enoyl-CoA hydratase/carnithine racemase
MSEPVVTLAKQGAVGLITLNRPPANSYDMAFVRDFSTAIDQTAKDDDVRAVVVKARSKSSLAPAPM